MKHFPEIERLVADADTMLIKAINDKFPIGMQVRPAPPHNAPWTAAVVIGPCVSADGDLECQIIAWDPVQTLRTDNIKICPCYTTIDLLPVPESIAKKVFQVERYLLFKAAYFAEAYSEAEAVDKVSNMPPRPYYYPEFVELAVDYGLPPDDEHWKLAAALEELDWSINGIISTIAGVKEINAMPPVLPEQTTRG